MTGVYIHIPFCIKKCVYCDFLSFEEKSFEEYVRALIKELKAAHFSGKIDTVYIGGGTPTELPSLFLYEILQAIKAFPLMPGAEITIEANPGTLNAEYLQALKSNGVTRLSIGLQATQPFLLRALGRAHTFDEFANNFCAARNVGFKNINIDLMFSLPMQQIQHWQETLEAVISLSPEHISAYSLTPAENTPLWGKIERGELTLPDDAADREMYHEARKMLADAGYVQYEISNFSKPGYESRHNINCWTMKPYIGFGLGAHSFDGKIRWSNAENFKDYYYGIKNILPVLLKADLMAETMILGLRLTRGVNEKEFAEKFSASPSEIYKNEIEKLKTAGLLNQEKKHLFLTPRGMDLANHVFCEFIQAVP